MIKKQLAFNFLQKGFAVFPVDNNKVPIGSWKAYQDAPMSEVVFNSIFSDESQHVGIACGKGSKGVEVIDVDTKHAPEEDRESIKEEFIKIVSEQLPDYEKKVGIYETMSGGYHLIYRCRNYGRNEKISNIKLDDGSYTNLIETRGQGGYVVIYPYNKVKGLDYIELDYISDLDRKLLLSAAKYFNQEPETIKETYQRRSLSYVKDGLSVFEDFNNRSSTLDLLVEHGFTIVRELRGKITIRRPNATTPHSGYIFKDSGLAYLFSTGTVLPHEKTLDPVEVYTWLNHGGDYARASRDLYDKGYGDRKKEVTIKKEKLDIESFPINCFPEFYSNYIMAMNKAQNLNIDFMASALLWVTSSIIGNSVKLKIKNGHVESACVWVVCVGDPGVMKSPSISAITEPFEDYSNSLLSEYINERRAYDQAMETMTPKERKEANLERPINKQIITTDPTIESLIDLHSNNQKGIALYRDELAGWIKDMNKYREGSDIEVYLSIFSGKSIVVNRKTQIPLSLKTPYVPVLGGIQPSILSSVLGENNKDNGFADRLLVAYPNSKVPDYTLNEIQQEHLDAYDEKINELISYVECSFPEEYEYDKIKPNILNLTDAGLELLVQHFNTLNRLQNKETEDTYIMSLYPKMQSYLARFAIILCILDGAESGETDLEVDVCHVNGANDLVNYYINCAKRLRGETVEKTELRTIFSKIDGNIEHKVSVAYGKTLLNGYSTRQIAKALGSNQSKIQRILKQITNEKDTTSSN